MRIIKAIILICFVMFSCSKHDYFNSINTSPEIYIVLDNEEIKNIDTIYNINEDSFQLDLRIRDDQGLSKIVLETIKGTADYRIKDDSVLKIIPLQLGLNEYRIVAVDPYGKEDFAVVNMDVIDNYLPIPHLSFELLDNDNYKVNASKSYDPDGKIVKYHFDAGERIIEWTGSIVEIWSGHVEDNGGVTLTLTDDKGGENEPKLFEVK